MKKRKLYGLAYPDGSLVHIVPLGRSKPLMKIVAHERTRCPDHASVGPYQVVKLTYKPKEQ